MTPSAFYIAAVRFGMDFEKKIGCDCTMSETYTDYNGKYLKIRKAVYEAGFDEFYQAGCVNRFHKMNIVAESAVLGKRFWFCVDGGYSVKDDLYIAIRDLNTNAPDERVYCKSQEDMAGRIKDISKQIAAAKAEKKGD